MAATTSDLIVFADGRTLNLARVVTTEWYQPPARRGKPAPARELLITTDIAYSDKDGQTGPYLIFVADDDGGASALWNIIQAYARPLPAPSPTVTVEPFIFDSGIAEQAPVVAGTSFFAGEVEVFLDGRDPDAEVEVYSPWGGPITPERLLAAAESVATIVRDPRFPAQRSPLLRMATLVDAYLARTAPAAAAA